MPARAATRVDLRLIVQRPGVGGERAALITTVDCVPVDRRLGIAGCDTAVATTAGGQLGSARHDPGPPERLGGCVTRQAGHRQRPPTAHRPDCVGNHGHVRPRDDAGNHQSAHVRHRETPCVRDAVKVRGRSPAVACRPQAAGVMRRHVQKGMHWHSERALPHSPHGRGSGAAGIGHASHSWCGSHVSQQVLLVQ